MLCSDASGLGGEWEGTRGTKACEFIARHTLPRSNGRNRAECRCSLRMETISNKNHPEPLTMTTSYFELLPDDAEGISATVYQLTYSSQLYQLLYDEQAVHQNNALLLNLLVVIHWIILQLTRNCTMIQQATDAPSSSQLRHQWYRNPQAVHRDPGQCRSKPWGRHRSTTGNSSVNDHE